jgi:glutaredoxin
VYLKDRSYYFVWGKKHCPWCLKAVSLLQEQENCDVRVFDMQDNEEALQRVKENFNWPTIPVIFKITSNGEQTFIGGFTDLDKHLVGQNND